MKHMIKRLAYFFLYLPMMLISAGFDSGFPDRKKIDSLPLWLAIVIHLCTLAAVVFFIWAVLLLTGII